MTIITRISQAMQQVLSQTAMKAAQETGFIQRQMKVSGANFCQTVVLGWSQTQGSRQTQRANHFYSAISALRLEFVCH